MDRRAELLERLTALETERLTLLVDLISLSVTIEEEDELLTVHEAARILKVTVDWLYRHADDLAFTIRPGPGQVRFSRKGLQRYLERKQG